MIYKNHSLLLTYDCVYNPSQKINSSVAAIRYPLVKPRILNHNLKETFQYKNEQS